MQILKNVSEVSEANGQRIYKFNDGSQVAQEMKPISRVEAKQKLINYVNSDPCYGAFSSQRNYIYVDRKTKLEIPFEKIVARLETFEKLRNYEIEYLLGETFNESFQINEPCPFNG